MNGKKLLLIALTVLIGLWLMIMPLPAWAIWWRPEWVLLVMLYWILNYPDEIGLFSCWIIGFIIDLLNGTMLGEHALALTFVGFLAIKVHRQIRVFPVWQQTLYIGILVLIYQLIIFLIQGISGGIINSLQYWLATLTSIIIWPWIYYLLQSYERKLKIA